MLGAIAIHKSFGDHHVLKGVSLTVARGEVVTLIRRQRVGEVTPSCAA